MMRVRDTWQRRRRGADVKRRRCLKCTRDFPSTGPGNRLCEDCNEENTRLPRRLTEEPLNVDEAVDR